MILDQEKLNLLGFENEEEYNFYLKVRESLTKEVKIGIAS